MMGPIGSSAVIVMLGLAIAGFVMLVLGARRGDERLIRAGYGAVYSHAALGTVAVLAMVVALVTHDFSVLYVSQVGSRSTPVFYTIISLWSALEGSILFWGFVLAAYAGIVVWLNRLRAGNLMPYAAATLMVVAAFFDLLLVGPSDPFTRVSPVPPDGPGPNPLLQNHWLMALHPPLLYLGYVGMTVPFAFAMGAALSGELGKTDWLLLSKKWTVASWAFLSSAIVAGMWWSYEVLGWGGYWAWDPVENASLMPWLTATAFLHSAMVQRRSGSLKIWNLSLIVSTFLLTVLGTFLTRSGVLTSVHSFTKGPIGFYFLGFMAVVLLAGIAVLVDQPRRGSAAPPIEGLVSRGSAILFNNLLFAALTFTVLLGTLFPIVAEAVRGVRVSVGAPFFNKMTLPLVAITIFLMGVGPMLPWGDADRRHARKVALPGSAGALVGLLLALVIGLPDAFAILTFVFGGFVVALAAADMWRDLAARRRSRHEDLGHTLLGALAFRSSRYGAHIAHVGIVLMAVGVATSSTLKRERDVTLRRGESVTVAGVAVQLEDIWAQEQQHRFVVGATLHLSRNGERLGTLTPRQNFYPSMGEPFPTPGVRSRLSGDVYTTLLAFERSGASATIRIVTEPLVGWIWIGGGVLMVGALVSLWPRRRRHAAPEEVTARKPIDNAVPVGAGAS